MKEYKIIAFDLDGTLIDTAPDLYLAANTMLSNLGQELINEAQARSWIGNGMTVFAKRLLSKAFDYDKKLNPELVIKADQQLRQAYLDNICVQSRIYEGVFELLTTIHNSNTQMALLTNKDRQFTFALLNQLQLLPLFDFVVCGNDVKDKKPAPEGVHLLSKQSKIQVKDMLIIGDSANDILAAQQAGCDVIAVSYGYHQNIDLEALKPTAYINKINELYSFLTLKEALHD